MITAPLTRRVISTVLLILGGVLIFLAPQNAWIGFALLGAGLVVEVIREALNKFEF